MQKLQFVDPSRGPYCNPDIHGRKRFSPPAYLGAVGHEVLDMAWDDRSLVNPKHDMHGQEQEVRTAWYRRLLSPLLQNSVRERWGHGIRADEALTLEGLYLGAIQGWYNSEAEAGKGLPVSAFSGRHA
jgi:hypothetical protein